MPIFTGTGDFGCTMIRDGSVSKSSHVIEAIGSLDELQSALDLARLHSPKNSVYLIENIQDKLRFLAGEVAGYITDENKLITKDDIVAMETVIEEIGDVIPKKFMRFSHPVSVYLNEARVRTRNLERKMVVLLNKNQIRESVYKYINRLSDLFFVLSYKVELSHEK